MKKSILIAGGSGLVGSHLSKLLADRGDEVTILSRKKKETGLSGISYATWNPEKGELEADLEDFDFVVNLAGASLAGKRWTKKYKEEIIWSRVESTKVLVGRINELSDNKPGLIQISGVNYYGADSEKIHSEADAPGTDFIGRVCKEWEAEAMKLKDKSKLSILRLAPVLAREGGALPTMALPVRFGLGAALGTGRQSMPWIHIDDICGIILWLIDNPGKVGIYNVAAPESVTNKEFTRNLSRVLMRPFFLPNVPKFALRLALGELADSLTGNTKVSIMRLIEAGYRFRHPNLKEALSDLLKRKN